MRISEMIKVTDSVKWGESCAIRRLRKWYIEIFDITVFELY